MKTLKKNPFEAAARVLAIASAAMLMTAPAMAEGTKDLNLGLMHWIRDTVCVGAQEVVFVPVSNDTAKASDQYAVIDLADPDPDSAHIVTANQRHWLRLNGCDAVQSERVRIADVRDSADLDL